METEELYDKAEESYYILKECRKIREALECLPAQYTKVAIMRNDGHIAVEMNHPVIKGAVRAAMETLLNLNESELKKRIK